MVLLSKKTYFLFALVIICPIYLLAQARFTATISPANIGKNETFELRLMVENSQDVDQINPPSLKDFSLISGPNRESGMESINGVVKQYIGISYILKPKSTGNFIIAAATAKADGKTLKSDPVRLEVTKNSTLYNQNNATSRLGGLSLFPEPAAQSAFKDFIIKKGENLTEKINKNIFIKVDVSQHSCFVGEPVIVTYKLYTRLKSESSITKNPSFNGFSVIDLLPPGNTYYSIERLNGREYNVYTLRKSQLYPLQPGVAELESAEVENNIHFIKEEYVNQRPGEFDDLFQDFTQTVIPAEGIQDEKVTLQSKPALITVKPLPDKDKIALFKGAVGNFTIDARLEKNNFTTDDAGKLYIAIAGSGNMPLIVAPDVAWPNGIEPYEVKVNEQLNKFVVPVSGRKVFEYPFTVAKPGNYTIPSIAFSFFDVKENRYKTTTAGPLPIIVTSGNGKRQEVVSGDAAKSGREQFFDTLFTNRWLIVVPLAILILVGLLVWLRKDKKKYIPAPVFKENEVEKQESLNTVPQAPINPLILTEEKLLRQDSQEFYETLSKELRQFLADKFQVPVATINKKTIADEADKNGLAVHTALQIQQLLDDIEWQLYTPFVSEGKMQDMYNDAYTIVHVLNTTAV